MLKRYIVGKIYFEWKDIYKFFSCPFFCKISLLHFSWISSIILFKKIFHFFFCQKFFESSIFIFCQFFKFHKIHERKRYFLYWTWEKFFFSLFYEIFFLQQILYHIPNFCWRFFPSKISNFSSFLFPSFPFHQKYLIFTLISRNVSISPPLHPNFQLTYHFRNYLILLTD